MKNWLKYLLAVAVIVGATVIAPQMEALAGKVVTRTRSYSAASSVSTVPRAAYADVPVIDDQGGGSCDLSATSCDASQGVSRTRTRTKAPRAKHRVHGRARASYEGCDMTQIASPPVLQNATPPVVAAPAVEPPAVPAPPSEK